MSATDRTSNVDHSIWGPADGPDLTEVELYFDRHWVERWLRFGQPIHDHSIDAYTRVVTFPPNAVFAFVRWAGNEHGTIASRIDIVRAVEPGEPLTQLPFVSPGGEIVARLSGWPKVKQMLEHIDSIEALGVAPADVCLDHWRHASHRIEVRETPRPYTLERHTSWLRRREVGR